jgi:hypothetical protein
VNVKVICRCITEFTIELKSENYPEPLDEAGMIAHELAFFENNSDDYFEIASVADECKYHFEVVRAL